MLKNKAREHGYGLPEILLLIFIVLKLTGNIEWSWWWVLSPAWVFIGGFILYIIVSRLISLLKNKA